MLALELAAVRPEAFSHLVLVSPLGLWVDDDPVADPFGTTLTRQRELLTADPARTAPFFDDVEGRDAAGLADDGVARYTTRTAAASLVWPIPEFGLASRLHLVRCPVTLVWGESDRLNPPSYLERYAEWAGKRRRDPRRAGCRSSRRVGRTSDRRRGAVERDRPTLIT